MIHLDELVSFLRGFMGDHELAAMRDTHLANGLQVRGAAEIHTLATGVSANLALFEAAVAAGAQAVLVHHSMTGPAGIHFDHVFINRLRYLLAHDLSLIGYHYLLDCHPQVGHSAQAIARLGGRLVEPYGRDGWGWVGEFDPPADRDGLLDRCAGLFGQGGTRYDFGPREVRRVVVISGGGAPYARDMEWLIQNGVDLFITGEVKEPVRELFREAGMSFAAGGHYNTEKLGVLALGDVIADRLDVEVEFIDLPNPA